MQSTSHSKAVTPQQERRLQCQLKHRDTCWRPLQTRTDGEEREGAGIKTSQTIRERSTLQVGTWDESNVEMCAQSIVRGTDARLLSRQDGRPPECQARIFRGKIINGYMQDAVSVVPKQSNEGYFFCTALTKRPGFPSKKSYNQSISSLPTIVSLSTRYPNKVRPVFSNIYATHNTTGQVTQHVLLWAVCPAGN
jgi:hypothetical protein